MRFHSVKSGEDESHGRKGVPLATDGLAHPGQEERCDLTLRRTSRNERCLEMWDQLRIDGRNDSKSLELLVDEVASPPIGDALVTANPLLSLPSTCVTLRDNRFTMLHNSTILVKASSCQEVLAVDVCHCGPCRNGRKCHTARNTA